MNTLHWKPSLGHCPHTTRIGVPGQPWRCYRCSKELP